ncbi:hypothetical protein [Pseudomonas sp. MD330_11]|uniref:hypothetical protein n=1 Tax=Pseudomonas sp. MD330_11 TaxID=3241255 RepID=UPI0036D28892
MTSAVAFAEGGSERSKELYNNFAFIQEQNHGHLQQQTAAADGRDLKNTTVEQSGIEQQA